MKKRNKITIAKYLYVKSRGNNKITTILRKISVYLKLSQNYARVSAGSIYARTAHVLEEWKPSWPIKTPAHTRASAGPHKSCNYPRQAVRDQRVNCHWPTCRRPRASSGRRGTTAAVRDPLAGARFRNHSPRDSPLSPTQHRGIRPPLPKKSSEHTKTASAVHGCRRSRWAQIDRRGSGGVVGEPGRHGGTRGSERREGGGVAGVQGVAAVPAPAPAAPASHKGLAFRLMFLDSCSSLWEEWGSSWFELVWLAGGCADDHGGVPRWRQRLRGAEALRVPEDWEAPAVPQDGTDAAFYLVSATVSGFICRDYMLVCNVLWLLSCVRSSVHQ